MTSKEKKPKTLKDRRREREILNMTEEELLKYIKKNEKIIKGLEEHLEIIRETAELSKEERERNAHEIGMKHFPELEERYQKYKKEQNKQKSENKRNNNKK